MVNERKVGLRRWLHHSRASTLSLFSGLDYETFCRQAHPHFSPVGWHLGHIGYVEAFWILEHCAGLPPVFPEYARLFAVDALPKEQRTALPPLSEVCEYVRAIRLQVLEYLEQAHLESEERLWRWLIQHEGQHAETISWVLQLQGAVEPVRQESRASLVSEMVSVEAGECVLGDDSLNALDNERPNYRTFVPDFSIDRYPVTQRQYQAFIEAGGYCERQWWSSEGWNWLAAYPVTQPLYWSGADARPVVGVSYYEAEAYANFVGKRLPTEAEWEKAASWHPEQKTKQNCPQAESETGASPYSLLMEGSTALGSCPTSHSAYGCEELFGNVWEWTSTWFHPYDGFVNFPYAGYSETYFDDRHRVLKGGSWVTRTPLLRASFRNWYEPGERVPFAGFRCAR